MSNHYLRDVFRTNDLAKEMFSNDAINVRFHPRTGLAHPELTLEVGTGDCLDNWKHISFFDLPFVGHVSRGIFNVPFFEEQKQTIIDGLNAAKLDILKPGD
tara:strand:- start:2206 stop:2508 length:303 start_codon:yes stop_codon:yes gene_type:complete